MTRGFLKSVLIELTLGLKWLPRKKLFSAVSTKLEIISRLNLLLHSEQTFPQLRIVYLRLEAWLTPALSREELKGMSHVMTDLSNLLEKAGERPA